MNPASDSDSSTINEQREEKSYHLCCPVCSAKLVQEKCKVVCRSEQCIYRIIMNCSEF